MSEESLHPTRILMVAKSPTIYCSSIALKPLPPLRVVALLDPTANFILSAKAYIVACGWIIAMLADMTQAIAPLPHSHLRIANHPIHQSRVCRQPSIAKNPLHSYKYLSVKRTILSLSAANSTAKRYTHQGFN